MSVELRPLGVTCNIGCQYCYQNMHRDAGNGATPHDLEAMKAAVEAHGGPFHLFGGEPLLMNKRDLEQLLAWGYERFGTNGIQTNGALIDDDHLRMFVDYAVDVGVSIDGPGPLNDLRWAGTLASTREATARSERALERLVEVGIVPGVMIQLTRCNCSPERLPILHDWCRALDQLGIRGMRLHVLEIDNPDVRRRYAMSAAENIAVLESMFALQRELKTLHFDLPHDLEALLRGNDDDVPCVWRACDPWTTEAVYGVDGRGERHNCGLTDKEGINFQRPEQQGFERYIALYHTPQEYNGCRDCRFFLACKGQCPGTGVAGDWRNRSEYCEVYKRLFEHVEAELLARGEVPISLDSRRRDWERRALEAWARAHNTWLTQDLEWLTQDLE
jgi:uncharacterized protein